MFGPSLSAPSPDPMLDLEAGGSFEVGLVVILPYLPATPSVVIVVVLGMTRMRAAQWMVPVTGVPAALFVFWGLGFRHYLDHLPDLSGFLYFGLLLAACSVSLGLVNCVLITRNVDGRTHVRSRACPKGIRELGIGRRVMPVSCREPAR